MLQIGIRKTLSTINSNISKTFELQANVYHKTPTKLFFSRLSNKSV